MRNGLLVTAAISLLSAPACTMTRSGRTGTIAAGIAATMVGTAMVTDEDGVKGPLDDDYAMPGMMLVAAGAMIAAVGLGSTVRQEAPASDVPPPAPTAYVPTSSAPPSMTMSFSTGAAIAPHRTLPELPVDPVTLRLAQQTREIISSGQCEAARPLLVDISARDERYHQELVASAVLDPCPALRAPAAAW